MAKFLSELDARCIADNKWTLISPLLYQSDIAGKIEVPALFITDFASVPRLPLAYLAAGGTAHKAAVIHDWLYWANGCTRKQADEVFLEAMKVTGIPLWRRKLMYWAVRIGAGSVWDKYRGKEKWT